MFIRYWPLLYALGSLVTVLCASQTFEQVGLPQRPTPGKSFLHTLFQETTAAQQNPLSLSNGIAQALSTQAPIKFAVFAGGGSPDSNEIALEKNVRYFQRTLRAFGISAAASSLFFANGTDGKATVRYINPQGKEQFKPPDIPNLIGASTPRNLRQWVMTVSQEADRRPIFFYFTGHGIFNPTNSDNNAMLMWGDSEVSVRGFTQLLDRIPQAVPVALMMAQCYSGGFANVIYEQGNPANAVSPKSRCGFFATVKTRPSLGCTPEVDEADYQDYSSSFFAGLSGINRLGQTVGSADYDKNGKVAYIEAHAFAKVDDAAADWPVSTSEEWLQRQISDRQRREILQQPIQTLLQQGRPEQQYVVRALVAKLKIDARQPAQEFEILTQIPTPEEFDITQAYGMRLRMELLNIGAEVIVRQLGNRQAIAILEQLLKCEFSSWI